MARLGLSLLGPLQVRLDEQPIGQDGASCLRRLPSRLGASRARPLPLQLTHELSVDNGYQFHGGLLFLQLRLRPGSNGGAKRCTLDMPHPPDR